MPHKPNFEFIRRALAKSVLRLIQIVFAIIWMNEIYSRAGSPLVDGHPEILKCYVASARETA